MEILCFYAGIVFIEINKLYPLLLMGIVIYFRPQLSFILWFIGAMIWTIIHQTWVNDSHMPQLPVLPQVHLSGKIVSIPVVQGEKVQFNFETFQFNGKAAQANIALTCYDHCPELHAGQIWHLIAKIKKPRNLGNPGSFNYVNWLKARHIHWVGTVRRDSFKPFPKVSTSSSLLSLREYLLNKQASLDKDLETLGIIQALTLGVASQIDKSQWDLFRHTGTTHLIDISGAHIGLIAGITFTLVNWLWRKMRCLCLIYPAPKIASLVALCFATVYTFLSGFAVPAQRALVACSFMLIRHFCHRRFTIWQAWRYALFVVLILEPHSVLSPGFYLSFMGIAILVTVNQRFIVSGMTKRLLLQVACLVGMMPLTLFWFSYGSLNGLLANIISIPLVELWIVPLALLITFLPHALGNSIIYVLKKSILLFLAYLNWVDSFAAMNLTSSFNQIASPLALISGLSLSVFLPFTRFIIPIAIMMLSALFPSHVKIKPNHVRIDVMDVGQGLSVVINTAKHTLIYDTGARFFRGGDMAKSVIIPYLKFLGIKQIDTIVISHPDIDHRGGLASLEENYPIKELIVDDPEFYHRGHSCHDDLRWTWDGVTFRFFPIHLIQNKKNNRSCVLQIKTQSDGFLLTGDIEKMAEDDLIHTYGAQLQSTIVLVPHHASQTSSSESFLDVVSPQYAIASYGFDNRYHFPHSKALLHYQQRNIPLLNTESCGMITTFLGSKFSDKKITCYN